MSIVYGATRYQIIDGKLQSDEKECATMQEAKDFVQEVTPWHGQVITWHVGPNLPNALPLLRYSSCALTVCHNETGFEWKEVNIF